MKMKELGEFLGCQIYFFKNLKLGGCNKLKCLVKNLNLKSLKLVKNWGKRAKIRKLLQVENIDQMMNFFDFFSSSI